jgi:hypothetical protein
LGEGISADRGARDECDGDKVNDLEAVVKLDLRFVPEAGERTFKLGSITIQRQADVFFRGRSSFGVNSNIAAKLSR